MKNLPFTITNVSVKFSVLKDLCFHCIVIVIVIVSNVVFVICFFVKCVWIILSRRRRTVLVCIGLVSKVLNKLFQFSFEVKKEKKLLELILTICEILFLLPMRL